MHKLIPKNKKIVYGIIALFVIVAGVFIWNNYQIEIFERPVKPSYIPSPNKPPMGKEVPFESIVKNDGMTNSYDENPEEFIFAVVTEEKKFIELWKKMHPSDEQLPPWPWADFMVDFKRDDVVVSYVRQERFSLLFCRG